MKRIGLALVVVVIFLAIAGAGYAYVHNRNTSSPLLGISVPQSAANRRAVAVMLDNFSPDARPQSGLDRASMVFETLTEGGITRFMAVYQEYDAPTVGPIRSTRFYFNSWAASLGVIFGHDGGNVDALQQLPSLTSIFNIDADKTPQPFYRTTNRAVPHNEYTSTNALRSYATSHGGSDTGPPPSLPHKDDAPLSARPAGGSITIPFSGPDYNVVWTYNRAANEYLRSMGGSSHVEASTGKQLTAKNVVVMYTDETPAPDPFTVGAIHMRTEGTGKATVYRDGVAVNGTWSKATVNAPLQWLDSGGNAISLNRGVTWVEVVPVGTNVTAGS